MRHRDPHDRVGHRDGLIGESLPLGAEHEGNPLRGRGGEVPQAHRGVGEGEGGDVEPGTAQQSGGRVPVRHPRPWHLQHRAHAHPDSASVERVGAAGGDEHGIRSDRSDRTEDRADVGRVGDVLEHDHATGVAQQRLGGGEFGPVHGRDEPAVQQVPRQVLQ